MAEQATAPVDLLSGPATYQEQLAGEPPQWHPDGFWLVTRDADVREALANPDLSNRFTLFPHYPADLCREAQDILGELADVPQPTAGGDGPLHRRARRAIIKSFEGSRTAHVDEMRDIVEARTDELIAALPSHAVERTVDDITEQEVDLVQHFAWELPLRVISDVLGLDPSRYEDIKRWSMGQIALVWGRPGPEQQVEYARGLVNLWKECEKLVDIRRSLLNEGQQLPSDLTSRLMQDGRLDDKEVAAVALNMAVAGHETTAKGIGNAVVDQMTRGMWSGLAASSEPERASVVEEELRLHPPIKWWSRYSTQPVLIGGVEIPADQRILLGIAMANLDNERYEDPSEYAPGEREEHLSFGYGLHNCLGAPLARMEMIIALGKLAQAYPDARLSPDFDPALERNMGFHGFKEARILLGRKAVAAAV
jgi:cytochrome P450